MIFEFPAILLLILETSTFPDSIYLLKQLSFSKCFFRICFYHVKFFQNYLFVFPSKLNFAVSLVASFPRQKPLKSKNKKHRIFWNTEFYHPAKFKLKGIKMQKLFLGCRFLRPIGLACEHSRNWPMQENES